MRGVIVFDAAEVHRESEFWAGVLGGRVVQDDDGTFDCVIDSTGAWRIGVQLAPDHVAPGWPDGPPQQVHLDLHVDSPRVAHEEVIALGARLLLAAPDLSSASGHQVYADPAGHPFCLGWGHPSNTELKAFLATNPEHQTKAL